MGWDENSTLQFVKLYTKHECLWNPAHSGYKMQPIREKAYFDLGNEFKQYTGKQMWISDIKQKIKYLRSTYCDQLDKISKRSTPEENYKPTLIWFHEMDKCLKTIPSNRRVNNLNSLPDVAKQADNVMTSQTWININPLNQSDETKSASNMTDNCEPANSEDSDSKPNVDPTFKRYKNLKIKRRKLQNKCHSASNLVEDEFDIFGKFVASNLRVLNLKKALKVQLEIHSMINDAWVSESE